MNAAAVLLSSDDWSLKEVASSEETTFSLLFPLFWIGLKIFFARPFGLLRNGDYAPSYFRNVTVPAAHKNPHVPRQGRYAPDPGPERSTRLVLDDFSADYGHSHLLVSFLNDFILVGKRVAGGLYPLGQ